MTSAQQNRLAREKSPYLLQHASNPVDWFPWSEEAFEKARREDKPIFLSIGYSTCHWCHVMEHESFSNPEIAALLNDHFVSIKVDREERPDIDQIYMTAVMAMTRSGGWPLSAFLSPDQKPFYGGTYFPPDDRHGRAGFATLLKIIHQKWIEDRNGILQAGDQITSMLNQSLQKNLETAQTIWSDEILKKGISDFQTSFDSLQGGFGPAPKFPRPHVLLFLMREYKKNPAEDLLAMIEITLEKMAQGGLFDHLGGGFHRYSTDERWHVPHFEKMLYDQALLARAYTEAFQLTGKKKYETIVKKTLDYVLRDMTHPEGGFYSAEDADSLDAATGHKMEGAFYVWTEKEINEILSQEEADIFRRFYGVQGGGNVWHDPFGEFAGKNVLYQASTIEKLAKEFSKEPAQIDQMLNHSMQVLFQKRKQRNSPHLDDKILTDWNALMISSFAYAGQVFQEEKYQKAAQKAANFLWSSLRKKDGLLHRWRENEAAIPAFLDDVTFLGLALLDLYETVFNIEYLERAKMLAEDAKRFFWDVQNGGFYFSSEKSETLVARSKELYDGAVPSGNSIATLFLARLGRFLGEDEKGIWISIARENMEFFSEPLSLSPSAYPLMLMAYQFLTTPGPEIVLTGKLENLKTFARRIRHEFLPQRTLIQISNEKESNQFSWTAQKSLYSDKESVFICKNFTCQKPIQTFEELEVSLKKG